MLLSGLEDSPIVVGVSTMAERRDVVVVGGGPSGAAFAYRAASAGVDVLLLDKATFPRDKPCGDGLTPRAVRRLGELGVAEEELTRFHRIDGLRVFGPKRSVTLSWSTIERRPAHGYVAPRTELDRLLLERARAAGAEIREGHEALAPVLEERVVRGVRVRVDGREQEFGSRLLVAADGAVSRIARGGGIVRSGGRIGVAIRAVVGGSAPDDSCIEMYFTLRRRTGLLPGYGWVFPLGDGRLNVGVALLAARDSPRLKKLFATFVDSIRLRYELPSGDELVRSRALQGWQIPTAFCVWPPWRPGLLAVGDAAGVAEPLAGEGISTALRSGTAAADVAVATLADGSNDDLRAYEHRLEEFWGSYYTWGRRFMSVASRPLAMSALVSAGVRPTSVRLGYRVIGRLCA
jgi:menaquinone-9 beta-reductase